MIYAIASLTVKNPEMLAAYRPKAAEALARHGGAVVHASRDLHAIDGAPVVPDVAALLSFPDVQSAKNWIGDPDLQDVHALRRGAGASDIFVLGDPPND